nr:calcium-dependent secretion activator-like [Parasteatoda tepidariorum]XP_042910407.1 calcium-dependent secretion activator-like [Parasteatoda tepidariorum]XP_042910408.1 calcium-dependent secretion activator-like [Parasteatoda tepidariorum]XP_042910409.1 calcium-dependent secretion activator-like [Parasteatoda tepidariorum]
MIQPSKLPCLITILSSLFHLVDEDLENKAFYAGHVLGAAIFLIKAGSQSVVYTVLMKDVMTLEEVRAVFKKCLENAALSNYAGISEQAKIEGLLNINTVKLLYSELPDIVNEMFGLVPCYMLFFVDIVNRKREEIRYSELFSVFNWFSSSLFSNYFEISTSK